MHDFILKDINTDFIGKELTNIGFDQSYINKACDKFRFKNIKIYSLTLPQANILKQTALSVGADCATHRETITAKVDKTDCILGGSISQLMKIADKLQKQPFDLKNLGQQILQQLNIFDNDTQIVGILNLTKDSFSDGFYDFESAKEHLKELKDADIIDIGAESTRPGFETISDENQLEKLVPIIKFINNSKLISVDTRSSVVAEECLKLGVKIINDVSGFEYDNKMPEVIAKYDAKVIIGHNTETKNLVDDTYLSLKNKIDDALLKGVKKEKIIIDVGIGFSKNTTQNFELIKRIDEFKSMGYPVMVGVSRKSLLGIKEESNEMKDIYTLAINSLLINKKVDFIRVHNVNLHKRLISMLNK